MPDNLDSRWARVHHAYGDASDVPGYLRALVGEDPNAAEEALHELWSCLCHQGTVYSASAAAVPLLLEILEQGTARNLRSIAWLVGSIAHGTGYLMVHGTLSFRRPRPEDAEVLTDERRVVDACRDAVGKGVPLFLRLLNVEDAGLRGSAIYALSRFATDPEVAGMLAARARVEAEENLRLALSLAQTYAPSSAPSVRGNDGSVFDTLIELARRGEVSEDRLFSALEVVLTEDLKEAEAFAREMMTEEAER